MAAIDHSDIEEMFNFNSGSMMKELFGASSAEELDVLGSVPLRASVGIGPGTADELWSDELQQWSRVDGAPLQKNGAERRRKDDVVEGRHTHAESVGRRPSGGGSEKGSSQKATSKRKPRVQNESLRPSNGSKQTNQNDEQRSKKRQRALEAVDKWNGLLKADEYDYGWVDNAR